MNIFLFSEFGQRR